MSIFDDKLIFQWEHHILSIGKSCHSTRIELFNFDDNFRRYSLWVRPFTLRTPPYPTIRGTRSIEFWRLQCYIKDLSIPHNTWDAVHWVLEITLLHWGPLSTPQYVGPGPLSSGDYTVTLRTSQYPTIRGTRSIEFWRLHCYIEDLSVPHNTWDPVHWVLEITLLHWGPLNTPQYVGPGPLSSGDYTVTLRTSQYPTIRGTRSIEFWRLHCYIEDLSIPHNTWDPVHWVLEITLLHWGPLSTPQYVGPGPLSSGDYTVTLRTSQYPTIRGTRSIEFWRLHCYIKDLSIPHNTWDAVHRVQEITLLHWGPLSTPQYVGRGPLSSGDYAVSWGGPPGYHHQTVSHTVYPGSVGTFFQRANNFDKTLSKLVFDKDCELLFCSSAIYNVGRIWGYIWKSALSCAISF